jgi:hypothetical protein
MMGPTTPQMLGHDAFAASTPDVLQLDVVIVLSPVISHEQQRTPAWSRCGGSTQENHEPVLTLFVASTTSHQWSVQPATGGGTICQ